MNAAIQPSAPQLPSMGAVHMSQALSKPVNGMFANNYTKGAGMLLMPIPSRPDNSGMHSFLLQVVDRVLHTVANLIDSIFGGNTLGQNNGPVQPQPVHPFGQLLQTISSVAGGIQDAVKPVGDFLSGMFPSLSGIVGKVGSRVGGIAGAVGKAASAIGGLF